MPPNDDLDRKIGERIRLARKSRQTSLAKLADELGLTYQQVQKYETGQNRISASTLFRTAEALDVDLAFLFAGCSTEVEERAAGSKPTHRGDASLRDALSRIRDPEVRTKLAALLEALASMPKRRTRP